MPIDPWNERKIGTCIPSVSAHDLELELILMIIQTYGGLFPCLFFVHDQPIKHENTYSKVTNKDELPAEEHRDLSL
jgi:hypothetical protein